MKIKWICIILIASIFWLIYPFQCGVQTAANIVSAAENPVLSAGNTGGQQGERIKIPVTISAGGYASYMITIIYDEKKVKCLNASGFASGLHEVNNNTAGVIGVAFARDEKVAGGGKLFDIEFEIIDSSDSIVDIKLANAVFVNKEGENFPVSLENGYITIAAKGNSANGGSASTPGATPAPGSISVPGSATPIPGAVSGEDGSNPSSTREDDKSDVLKALENIKSGNDFKSVLDEASARFNGSIAAANERNAADAQMLASGLKDYITAMTVAVKNNGLALDESLELFRNAVINAGKCSPKMDYSGIAGKKAIDSVEALAGAILYRYGSAEFTGDVEDNTLKVDVNSAGLALIKEKADNYSDIYENLNSVLKTSTIPLKLESQFVIKLSGKGTGNSLLDGMEASLSTDLLGYLSEIKFEKILVLSEVAGLEIPAGFSSIGSGASSIALAVEKYSPVSSLHYEKMRTDPRLNILQNDNIYTLSIQVTTADGKIIKLDKGFKIPEVRIVIPMGSLSSQSLSAGIGGKTVIRFTDKGYEYLTNIYISGTNSISFYTDQISDFGIIGYAPQFIDITGDDASVKTAVGFMAARGIINGKNGYTTYAPNDNLTRAEFAKLVVLTAGVFDINEKATAFVDVPAGKWFYPYVASASKAGIINGTSKNTFSPDSPITRQEMGVILGRLIREKKPSDSGFLLNFSDRADIAAWATEDLAAAVKFDIIKGVDGKINPKRYATRAEAACSLYSFYQY